MAHNDKDLLLKDLCARLPYGVWIEAKLKDRPFSAKCMLNARNAGDIALIEIGQYDFYKPYLFPLSSMTEEQLYSNPIGFSQMLTIKADRDWENITINRRAYYKLVDWFNKNHFDYRGLIPMGLAIDATGLNIY